MESNAQTKPTRGRMEAGSEEHHSEQPINRLPPEILSYVFTLVGKPSGKVHEKLFFGGLMAQVCRRWRIVALDTPMLWSYITLSELTPHERSATFLARSGDIISLDIDISIGKNYLYYSSTMEHEFADRTRSALEFIVAHGGATSRWETLRIESKFPSAIAAAMHFIHNTPLDRLRTLELNSGSHGLPGGCELGASVLMRRDSHGAKIFKTHSPLLRHIKLLGVPSNFICQDVWAPLVCNLTLLELVVLDPMSHLVTLRALLLHSPRLEKLSLCTTAVKHTFSHHVQPTSVRVNMPYLRQFILNEPYSVHWGVGVLMMIDAPGLEMFSLGLSRIQEADILPSYVAFGRTGEGLVEDVWALRNAGGAAIYPELKHLAITRMACSLEPLVLMLKAFPNITRLDWGAKMDSDVQLCRALEESTVCPQLEHLRIYRVPGELKTWLYQRAEQGWPLKTVEVDSTTWKWVPESLKQELGRSLERLGTYVNPLSHRANEMGYDDTSSREDNNLSNASA